MGIAIISKSLSLIKRDTCTWAIMSTVFRLYPLLLLITLSECARSGFISFFEDLFSDYFYQLETMTKRMNALCFSSEKDRWIYSYTFNTGRIPLNLFRKSFISCLMLERLLFGILMKHLPSINHFGMIRSWVITRGHLK